MVALSTGKGGDAMEHEPRWQDGVGLLSGAWLFSSPFFGFGPVIGLSAWDSYLFGIMILMLSGLALARPWLRQEKCCMLTGIWLIAAPFVLGFSEHHAATWSHIAIGLLFVADVLMAPGPGGRARA